MGNGQPQWLSAVPGDGQTDKEEPPPHTGCPWEAGTGLQGLPGIEMQPLSSPRAPRRHSWGGRRVTGHGTQGGSTSRPSPGDPELVPTGDILAGPGHRVLFGGVPAPVNQFLARYLVVGGNRRNKNWQIL